MKVLLIQPPSSVRHVDKLFLHEPALQLDEESQILIFNTEGDTDPEKYRSIVWDGECPSAAR